LLGGILIFVAIGVIAKAADVHPQPDRAWVLDVVRAASAALLLGGLWAFGYGLKREIIREVQGSEKVERKR